MNADAQPLPDLAALRAELDRIDDAIHALLTQRAETVARLAGLRSKGPVPLRPGREAAILRRLVGQTRPPLDPALVVRIWRDIMNGSLAQQAPMRLAAEAGVEALAREHFGPAPAITVDEPAAAMAAVAAGQAQAAVLGWPGRWWDSVPDGVHVVARLPFLAADGAGAMVLTAASADASGDDRTLVVGPVAAVREAGVAVLAEAGEIAVGESAGFLASGPWPSGVRVIGAYAAPPAGFPTGAEPA